MKEGGARDRPECKRAERGEGTDARTRVSSLRKPQWKIEFG